MKQVLFDSEGRMRSGFQILLAMVALLLSQLIPGFVVRLLGGGMLPYLVAFLLQTAVAVILYAVLFRTAFKNQNTASMDCFRFSGRGLLHLLVGLGLGIAAFSLSVLPLYVSGQYTIAFRGAGADVLAVGFAQFIAVGYAEELLTRGAMQHALMRFGKWISLAIVSAIFGLLHLANNGVTVFSILGIVLAGLVLGLGMYATNSIMLPVGFHITWNWVQGFVYGIPVSGGRVEQSVFVTTFVGENGIITGGEFGTEASLVCHIVLILFCVGFFLHGKKKGSFALYDEDKQAQKQSM